MDSLANKIFAHLQNFSNRDQNLVKFKRKLEELNAVKEDNQSMKSVELLQSRKKLKKAVDIWFRNVERINENILNDLENEVTRSNVFSLVGERVLNRIDEVDHLLEQGKSFDGLAIDDPQWIGQVLSTPTLFGELPKKLLEEIWKYMIEDRVTKIGVWGMGGVGKTILMKLIHNQLVKEAKKFTKVIWVTVSKDTNIIKLQNSIACEINKSFFDDDEEEETIRAGKLYELLFNLGKYVLILDDLWANLSLEEVGIPEPSNGSKLVITTRSLDVCNYLGCLAVRIPTLKQQDAWCLFLEKVGKDIEHYPDVLPFVRSVADECDGLPLAIVTIARTMKKVRDTRTWRNALCELKKQVESVSGENEKIFQKLRFSYDHLGDEKVKLCFLCCALYPEDCNIKINNLINLWIAEGYVEEMNSMQAEIDRGHAILNKLKNCCLIEDGYSGHTVKLHDIVRDMSLHITSSRPRFFVRAGRQSPKIFVQEWKESWEKVSFMGNLLLHIPHQMSTPNFPLLQTLLLSQCDIRSIAECFFEQMPMLRILDLSQNNHLESLPNSISILERLTTLLLGGCEDIEEMPSLSKLKDLKKLDLSYTGIEEVPHGIDELMKLRYLNLSYTSIREIDLGILANLTSLLYLKMTPYGCFSRINLGGRVGIKLLTQLEFLKGMSFDELEEFNRYTQALEDRVGREREWHHQYNIIVGVYYDDILYTEEKCIAFIDCEICAENINLPSNVEELQFWGITSRHKEGRILSNLLTCCGNARLLFLKKISIYFTLKIMKRNIKKLFSFDWASSNLQNLEKLTIKSYDDVRDVSLEEIISSVSESDEGTINLPRLRKLKLYDLPELKGICDEKVSLVCDSIEVIVIIGCPTLRRIPLIFPLGDDGLPSPPPSLKRIEVNSKEWWESAELDQPQAKSTVKHLLKYCLQDIADTDSSDTCVISDTDSSESFVVSDTDSFDTGS